MPQYVKDSESYRYVYSVFAGMKRHEYRKLNKMSFNQACLDLPERKLREIHYHAVVTHMRAEPTRLKLDVVKSLTREQLEQLVDYHPQQFNVWFLYLNMNQRMEVRTLYKGIRDIEHLNTPAAKVVTRG